ncbi:MULTISPECIES: WD40 repeat domain-containing protein [unclassified Arcicella]|uniref:WD40 repeat domain-containing protein n=1 Tax=unclassified Arcicella TaxID=2644986 RepID=UPI00285966E9|nr:MULTISPECIES: WD40 repeat domain-containing protein [unclassified Arcicella]MDR6561721.1 WD40 repeat protein [Arcicella sp. BE51]MDR6812501.1 WD40 repeat protein [Arcicella sp. BE140]MDR6823727.1 WD40 repeat protein [Arcicella sp. BE139]
MQVDKIDTFSGHRDCVYALEGSKDSSQFFSAGGDGLIVKWNLKTPDLGELIAQVPASVYAICLDKQRNQLWVGQNFDGIHLIDVALKQEIKSLKITSASIFDIKIYENIALIGLSDGIIVVMDVETFSVKRHLKASDKSVRSIAINELTKEFAVGYSDFSVKIFDLQDFSLKLVIDEHTNSIFSVCYSPDKKYLLTTGRDAHLKVWDVTEKYQLKHSIIAHLFAINHITYHPNGDLFATCSMDKSIKIWDAKTFKLLKVIDKARHAGHGTSVNKLFWSTYEHQLVSASDDKKISVWSLTN